MKKLIPFILLSIASSSAFALSAEERGLQIAKETERRDAGFKNSVANAKMILTNNRGDVATRLFRMKTLEIKGDGDKTLAVFDQPRDISGLAVLVASHGTRPDEQWLYLPELKRVKRIASKNKSGPFVGSEFSYEDIGSWEVDKYSYRFIREEILDGRKTFLVENTPRYEYSGYARQLEWVDAEIYHPRKIIYFDRNNKELKTLSFHDYNQYLGQYWRASTLKMENHQTGKKTVIEWENYQFQIGLNERDFDINSLKKSR